MTHFFETLRKTGPAAAGRWCLPASLVLLSLLATGCGMHRAGNTRVEDPGTQVISYPGATSVTWSADGKTHRVCTLPTAAAPRHPYGKHKPMARPHGNSLDAALFRLCEARGNGDLSAQQYTESVAKVLAAMDKHPMGHMGSMAGGCPHCQGKHPGKGVGPGGWGPPGQCPHCRMKGQGAPGAPANPEPSAQEPVAQ